MVGTKKSKFKKDKDKIYILITILTIFIISVVGYNYFLKESVVDRDVKWKLLWNEEIGVTITLVDQGSDEVNLQMQNIFLDDLDDSEFKLKRKASISGGWVSGNITKEGLSKLKKDERILRVYIPEMFHARSDIVYTK